MFEAPRQFRQSGTGFQEFNLKFFEFTAMSVLCCLWDSHDLSLLAHFHSICRTGPKHLIFSPCAPSLLVAAAASGQQAVGFLAIMLLGLLDSWLLRSLAIMLLGFLNSGLLRSLDIMLLRFLDSWLLRSLDIMLLRSLYSWLLRSLDIMLLRFLDSWLLRSLAIMLLGFLNSGLLRSLDIMLLRSLDIMLLRFLDSWLLRSLDIMLLTPLLLLMQSLDTSLLTIPINTIIPFSPLSSLLYAYTNHNGPNAVYDPMSASCYRNHCSVSGNILMARSEYIPAV